MSYLRGESASYPLGQARLADGYTPAQTVYSVTPNHQRRKRLNDPIIQGDLRIEPTQPGVTPRLAVAGIGHQLIFDVENESDHG